MIPNIFPGTYFAFEGIDGCGKTEVMSLFCDWLDQIDHFSVARTKQPDKNGTYGRAIYAELANFGGLHKTNPRFFQALYARDGRTNIQDDVMPILSKKKGIVVSDRCRLSLVYGASEFKDVFDLLQLNEAIIGEHFIWPDAIFVLDVRVEAAIKRLKRKGRVLDDLEQSEILFRTRLFYQHIADPPEAMAEGMRRCFPNCHLVPADCPQEYVLRRVTSIAKTILVRRGQIAE